MIPTSELYIENFDEEIYEKLVRSNESIWSPNKELKIEYCTFSLLTNIIWIETFKIMREIEMGSEDIISSKAISSYIQYLFNSWKAYFFGWGIAYLLFLMCLILHINDIGNKKLEEAYILFINIVLNFNELSELLFQIYVYHGEYETT